jgi:gamma-glutamyltranspeptidase/glutathione hydrolase
LRQSSAEWRRWRGGAPGGRRILDTVTQVLLNVIDHGQDAQMAVSGPFVDTSSPDVTLIDNRVPVDVRAALCERGHILREVTADIHPSFFARPAAISRDPATGLLRGGLDPYAEGAAAGY